MRADIFGTEKCKVNFGLKYTKKHLVLISTRYVSDMNGIPEDRCYRDTAQIIISDSYLYLPGFHVGGGIGVVFEGTVTGAIRGIACL